MSPLYIHPDERIIYSYGCLPSSRSIGRQHFTADRPRNQREKTNYYQRITIICYDNFSA